MNRYAFLIPVLLPLLCGASLPLWRIKKRSARAVYVLLSVLAASASVFALIVRRPQEGLTLLHLTGTLQIRLRMDGLSCVFAGLVAALWPLASAYAVEYMRHEGGETRFFALYTATFGITLGIAMSDNLITLYLFYELLTLITLPLVMHTGDQRSLRAGKKYLAYSIGGAACAFLGLMILYTQGNESLTFVYGGFAGEGGKRTLLLAGYLLAFCGFGVKAAVFPFHSWLPTAGVAPTPVTALLHAVAVVKAGVFAIMRLTWYCYEPAFLRGTYAQTVAMALAVFTIVFGSAMALREQHLKRRLAYSTVSNLSYIVFGVTLMTPEGLGAALSHMLFHGVMKITLFFCAGAIMHETKREYVPELRGLAGRMPFTFAAFTVGAAALVGVPLLPGFLSKAGLAGAALSAGGALPLAGVFALLASAALTAGYLFAPAVQAWFPARGEALPEEGRDPNGWMKAPLALLCLMMAALGMGGAGLIRALNAIASGAF